MSRFVYRKEGAEPKSWEFDPNKLLSPEAEAIERNTDWTFGEWLEKLGKGSILAFHALLFVFLKREYPKMRWDEVEFSLSEVDLELDDEDLRRAIETLQLKEDRTPAEEQALEDLLLRELAAGPKESQTEPTSEPTGSPASPPT